MLDWSDTCYGQGVLERLPPGGSFFPELQLISVLKAICGRNEAAVAEAANQLGWQGYKTDWRRISSAKTSI